MILSALTCQLAIDVPIIFQLKACYTPPKCAPKDVATLISYRVKALYSMRMQLHEQHIIIEMNYVYDLRQICGSLTHSLTFYHLLI